MLSCRTWFQRPAVEVRPSLIARWLDRYEDRGTETTCNRANTYLTAVFTGALPRRRIGVEKNPPRALQRRFREQSRDRWL